MYSSLKGRNLVMLPNGKTMAFKPANGGKDSLATSEAKELDAIEYARSRGLPTYLVQHANGVIYDVLTDRTAAINFRDATAARTPNGVMNVKLFESKAGYLIPIR